VTSTYTTAKLAGPRSLVLLQDRVLLMASTPTDDDVAEIDPRHGGLVASGKQAASTVTSLRNGYPTMTLLIEPTSASTYQASADEPFLLPADDGLFPLSLGDCLTGQRQAGASLVITPSGQVDAGDAPALKAIVNQANALDDADLLTLVPVSDSWLAPPDIDQLVAVLKRSRHPVLLGLVNSTDDPLSRQGAVAGYARLASEVPGIVMWRTDLSGLGALAHGAVAAVIGQRPSQRRYAKVGVTSRSSKLADKTPHVLLPELLRYSRAQQMRTEWFATSPSLNCTCEYCRGRDLDRFDKSPEAHEAAYLHNLTMLNQLVGECLSAADREEWWTQQLREAQSAHLELANRINRIVSEPASMRRWLRHSSI
jgi:hypothetical protein